MKNNDIYVVTHNQFGYQTDFYNYSKYLATHFDLHYVCWDQNKEKVDLQGISVHYKDKKELKLFALIDFVCKVSKTINRAKPRVVLIKYFPLCSFLRLSARNTIFILDIRTASVSKRAIINYISNSILYLEYLLFKHSIVLSQNIKERLLLKNANVIPLGADVIDNVEKSFETIRLLYVGSFNNRYIEKTIYGLRMFFMKRPDVNIKYTIVGSGSEESIRNITIAIANSGMNDIIDFKGAIPYNRLSSVFIDNNVGVSFIPITVYYDRQPPTKTYEYLMSGMPVLATNTFANKQIINENSGVLINDSPESFANGLEEIVNNKSKYSSSLIREMYKEFTWENIVNSKLLPLIQKLVNV